MPADPGLPQTAPSMLNFRAPVGGGLQDTFDHISDDICDICNL